MNALLAPTSGAARLLARRSCPACTFENAPGAPTCEVCTTPLAPTAPPAQIPPPAQAPQHAAGGSSSSPWQADSGGHETLFYEVQDESPHFRRLFGPRASARWEAFDLRTVLRFPERQEIGEVEYVDLFSGSLSDQFGPALLRHISSDMAGATSVPNPPL